MHLGNVLYDKKNDILILDGKSVLKLREDDIDFNLNLKIVLSSLFDAQKGIYTKKNRI